MIKACWNGLQAALGTGRVVVVVGLDLAWDWLGILAGLTMDSDLDLEQ